MRIYDPCVGSGGMLILSKDYVEEHGGDIRNLKLFGQDTNGKVWAICKMNMIFHMQDLLTGRVRVSAEESLPDAYQATL